MKPDNERRAKGPSEAGETPRAHTHPDSAKRTHAQRMAEDFAATHPKNVIIKQDEHMILEWSPKGYAVVARPQDKRIAGMPDKKLPEQASGFGTPVVPFVPEGTIDTVAYDGKLLDEFILTHDHEFRKTPFIIIDFAKQTYVSSTFCTALENIKETLDILGPKMLFAGLDPSALAMLETTGLIDKIGKENVFDTVEDAEKEIAANYHGRHTLRNPFKREDGPPTR